MVPIRFRRSVITRRSLLSGTGALFIASRGVPALAQRPPAASDATAEAGKQEGRRELLALLPSPGGVTAFDPVASPRVIAIDAMLGAQGLLPLGADEKSPSADAAAYLNALHDLPVSPNGFGEALGAPDGWSALFGFHPYAVHAVVDYGISEDYCAVIQANFDRNRLEEAWSALGYAPIPGGENILHLDMDETTRLTVGLEQGIMNLFSGSFDYAAILADDRIAMASSQERVAQALQLANGGTGSIIELPAVAACAGQLPADTTMALLLDGAQFRGAPLGPSGLPPAGPNLTQEQRDDLAEQAATTQALLEEIEADLGPMPALEMVVLAAAADHHILMLRPIDPEAATTALEIVSRRFEHMISQSTTKPYTDLLPIEDTRSADGVGVITFMDTGAPSLFQLQAAGDLGFLSFA